MKDMCQVISQGEEPLLENAYILLVGALERSTEPSIQGYTPDHIWNTET